jgi:diguanylate cyclase (GGDEF)-like protein
MNYLKKSLDKFRQDALSKLFYDLLKRLLIVILAFASTKFFPDTTSIGEFLTKKISLSVYAIFLIGLVIIGLTVLVVLILFNRKYQAVRNDNFTDELTGLKNHKAFHEYINNKVTSDRIFSIIIIDVDDFKRFNTDYNPNTADKILGKLGELLGNDKRVTDETFRQFLRGDEFVVIANETSLNDAIKAAERKRGLIAKTTFIVDDKPFKLTVSCGVTEFKKGKDDFTSLTNRVNQALVEAKGINGKNNTKSII